MDHAWPGTLKPQFRELGRRPPRDLEVGGSGKIDDISRFRGRQARAKKWKALPTVAIDPKLQAAPSADLKPQVVSKLQVDGIKKLTAAPASMTKPTATPPKPQTVPAAPPKPQAVLTVAAPLRGVGGGFCSNYKADSHSCSASVPD